MLKHLNQTEIQPIGLHESSTDHMQHTNLLSKENEKNTKNHRGQNQTYEQK